MKGRTGKGRKTKSRSKAAKTARGRSAKSKKASKSRKTSNSRVKRKVGRKQAPAKKKAARKTGSRASAVRGRARKNVLGEGNYAASREFRQEETSFVRRNRNRIPALGQQAAAALEGIEGNELRQAEATARSHSAGEDDD